MEMIEDIQAAIDRDRLTVVAFAEEQARNAFGGDTEIDVAQRRIIEHFRPGRGPGPIRGPAQLALHLIAKLGIAFSSTDAEKSVEATGWILVGAALFCGRQCLAFGPILELGLQWRKRQDVEPMRASGALASAVIKDQLDNLDLVNALALTIAKAIDDCEIGHDVRIDAAALFHLIAAEQIAGPRAPVVETDDGKKVELQPVGIEAIPPRHLMTRTLERRMEAMEQLRSASASLVDLQKTEPGDFDLSEVTSEAERARVESAWKATPRITMQVDTGRETIQVAGTAPADAMAEIMKRELAHAEQRAKEEDGRMAEALKGAPFYSQQQNAPVVGLAVDRICPQCAALMSAARADLWRCSNGHEFGGKTLAAVAMGIPVQPIADRGKARRFPPPPRPKK